MKRAECLKKAEQCVCGQREQDYGTPEDSFGAIALFWGVYLREAHPDIKKVMAINGITSTDVAMMMALLKIARISTGTATDDSFIDLAGYAACGCEISDKTT